MKSAEKFKVLHLVTRMNVGGVAVLVDNLLSNVDTDEFEVLLATGSCEYPESDFLENKSRPYSVHRINHFHKSPKLIDDVRAFISIIKLIRVFRPDIIHTHTSKAGLFGRLAAFCFLPGSKKVHTFHGHLLVGYFSRKKLLIVVSIERVLSLLTDGLIAMGTQVRDDLLNVKIGTKSNFRVFFPGLAMPQFPNRAITRDSLKFSDSRIYCIFVGRLTQIKRVDRVLEIAEITKKTNPNIEYLIVGDGDLSQRLQSQSEQRSLPIKFLGWRSDITELLIASDFLLLTSDNEAVALTLIEASQAGLPVITTPAGSVRDIAINEVNGVVTGFVVSEIAKTVIRLAEHPKLRETMGLKGKEITVTKFSIASMVSDHQNYYKELLR
jgi:glycosyltransferase involved in cell wall biosynthesis